MSSEETAPAKKSSDRVNPEMKYGFGLALALILAGCMFNTNTSSILVCIADIYEHFAPQGMDETTMSLLTTLPSLLMLPIVFIPLKAKFPQKTLIIIGWTIYGALGLSLMFIDNWIMFIIARGCMGIGLGIALPHPKALITKLYSPDKRASMIGYVSMVGGLVGITISISLGYVASLDWRLAMLVFPVFAVVVITLVALFVPKLPVEDRAFYGGKKAPLNMFVYLLLILGAVIFVVCSVIQVKAGLYVRESGIGSTQETGYISAVITAGTFCGGFLFGRVYNKLGRWSFPFFATISCIAYVVLSTSSSMVLVFVACFFCGYGSVGSIMPYLITRVAAVAPKTRKTDVITWMTACTYGGQFLGTFYLMAVANLFGPSAQVALLSVGGVFGILVVIALVFMFATRQKLQETIASLEE